MGVVSCNHKERVLDRGTQSAGRKLKGQGGPSLPFDYIICYGVVDIDPKHATVWAMLGGRADVLLPPYLGFRKGAPLPEAPTPAGRRPATLDPVTLRTITDMRDVIATELQLAGWQGVVPWIGFEAESRVAGAGGAFHYFK